MKPAENTSQNNLSQFGILTYLVVSAVCCHHYFVYCGYEPVKVWVYTIGSSFLVLINLIWTFLGMIRYYEINPIVAIIICLLLCGCFAQAKKGLICAFALIFTFLASTGNTKPNKISEIEFVKFYSEQLSIDKFNNDLRSITSNDGVYGSGISITSDYFKNKEIELKTLRCRSIRLDHNQLPHQILDALAIVSQLRHAYLDGEEHP